MRKYTLNGEFVDDTGCCYKIEYTPNPCGCGCACYPDTLSYSMDDEGDVYRIELEGENKSFILNLLDKANIELKRVYSTP